MRLMTFTDFCVLCKLVFFTYAFCYQFLMIFRCFGIFPLDRTVFFFTLIIPGSIHIVQVMQTVEIDLRKFRFTEPVSNLAIASKTPCTTSTRSKKAMLSHFGTFSLLLCNVSLWAQYIINNVSNWCVNFDFVIP